MREIKFKGQMTTGKWVYGLPYLDIKGSTAYLDECSYRICWNHENGGQSNAPIKNGTLSQFTGLKDINGIEIYENDILKYNGIVAWNDVELCWSRIDLNWNDRREWHNLESITSPLIVIGNTFDNPELSGEWKK